MLRVAICDDLQVFLNHIKKMLSNWEGRPKNMFVQTFEDADSLLTAHNSKPFDIILLDVIMPLLNGIEAAREIRQYDKSVKIVFLTTSPEFAVDSYTVHANNYLLKPVDPEKLYACLQELVEETQKSSKTIVVKSAKALHHVDIKNIEYLEAQNKHVLFALSNGTTITSIEPLYSYEDHLPLIDGFFKCSRSYIVNIHHIDTYTTQEIQMHSGYKIPISRNYQKEFEEAYFEVLFGKDGDK